MALRPPKQPQHLIGNNTSEIIVKSEHCAALKRHGIVVAGISDAAPPFSMCRLPAWHTEVLACFAGRGIQWVGGRWVQQTPGMVCIAPDGATQAFHAVRSQRWGFVWIQYHPGKLPLATREVTMATADPEALRASVALLHRELEGQANPAVLQQVADLLQMLVMRILGRHEFDPRVTRVIERVTADLSYPWTLRDLAKTAKVSSEQLRRLFHRYLGRSPLRRVLELRLAHAAERLRTTEEKLETIAHAVGYRSVYALSSAFSREVGCSPSVFRRRTRGASPRGR
ncbi:MAG: chbR [Polyangiaceae bacterium]|jgi:AraC-like DNA-binding protein|nr:chbR [Polyangiaceae bacterium]